MLTFLLKVLYTCKRKHRYSIYILRLPVVALFPRWGPTPDLTLLYAVIQIYVADLVVKFSLSGFSWKINLKRNLDYSPKYKNGIFSLGMAFILFFAKIALFKSFYLFLCYIYLGILLKYSL